jgi:two-component system chemotaxis response regulator CheY
MKKTILCVDDSLVIQQLVKHYLGEDYNIIFSNNGKEGLEKLADLNKYNITVSLILADLEMPVMGGPEFIEHVKKMPSLKYTPIVVMTSKNEDHSQFRFTYNSWVHKPFDRDNLLSIIDRVLDPIKYMKAKYSIKNNIEPPSKLAFK